MSGGRFPGKRSLPASVLGAGRGQLLRRSGSAKRYDGVCGRSGSNSNRLMRDGVIIIMKSVDGRAGGFRGNGLGGFRESV